MRIEQALPRVVFMGMSGATSATVLAQLLANGVEVAGVVVAAERYARACSPAPIVPLAPTRIPLLHAGQSPAIGQIAHERGIPAFELRRASAPETLQAIAELRPQLVCVACFPLRIPPALLALPPHGFLNMHPALLPEHRGPEPLFWIFRGGARTAGVTIHFMDEQLDHGDIAMQSPLALPDGISGAAAAQACATLGGELMAAALRALRDGTLARRPQPPGGSYDPWPAPEDWRISTGWPAQRAFNFMRGTAEWGRAYPLALGDTELTLATAIDYDPTAALAGPYARLGGEVLIQFAPGVLRARLG